MINVANESPHSTYIRFLVYLINTTSHADGSVTELRSSLSVKHCQAMIHLQLPRRPQNALLVFGVVQAVS